MRQPNASQRTPADASGPILITGATGHVGRELCAQLSTAGRAVRALTRRPEAIEARPHLEVVRGDFEDPASLDAALAGVSAVFSMSAQAIFAAPTPTHDEALAAACRRAGVRRIVKLSALGGGGRDPGSPIVRWVRAAEATVIESGADWTLLRPGRFMTNTLAWASMIRRGDDVSIPMAERRTASIDPADVARVAALALCQPGHAGQSYDLSGPEALTPADELTILGELLGRPLRLNALSNDAARAGMLRYGMPESVVDVILADRDRERGAEVLPTVCDLTGRPPRRFAEWAAQHRSAFVGES
ncbi:MAG TPA: NAD(P)H-binding protein [Polyangiaceae bacterium]|nr:NAD(P)H-binding protein [Polyangiaceae bacterium]